MRGDVRFVIGPYLFQVFSREVFLEATLQSPLADGPSPAIRNAAEVSPSPRFPTCRIYDDWTLAGPDNPNKLGLWHLGATGHATAFGDVTILWQDRPSRDLPTGFFSANPWWEAIQRRI